MRNGWGERRKKYQTCAEIRTYGFPTKVITLPTISSYSDRNLGVEIYNLSSSSSSATTFSTVNAAATTAAPTSRLLLPFLLRNPSSSIMKKVLQPENECELPLTCIVSKTHGKLTVTQFGNSKMAAFFETPVTANQIYFMF